MRNRRLIAFVLAALALCLLFLALLKSPVLAVERSIHIFPDKVVEGGKVDVRGTGFNKDYPDAALRAGFPFVTVYLALEEAEVGALIGVDVKTYAVADASSKVDEFGKFAAGFEVPGELADGAYVSDVEEGTYFVYVTFWNDTTIIAASVLEVTVVVEKFPFWFGYYSPQGWYPYHGCGPYYYYYYCFDCPQWDGVPHSYPWKSPYGPCCEDCLDEWPFPWPYGRCGWRVLPAPSCGC